MITSILIKKELMERSRLARTRLEIQTALYGTIAWTRRYSGQDRELEAYLSGPICHAISMAIKDWERMEKYEICQQAKWVKLELETLYR